MSLGTDKYRKIYAMLDAEPVPYDCGGLCGGICCSDTPFGDDGSYIYLLPGEKEYLDSVGSTICIKKQKRKEHDLPASWGKYVFIAECPGKEMCDRRTRPIQCRTFPLQPYINKEGELEMCLCYMDLPYFCPFVEGKVPVSEDFRRRTFEAWKMLVEDEAVMDLVRLDTENSFHDAGKL